MSSQSVRQRRPWLGRLLILTVCCLGCTGCGSKYPIAPAGGVVTRNGKPMVGGRVMFLPLGGGKSAIGQIEPDGSFVMSSYRSGDGAQVGENHVLIIEGLSVGSSKPQNFRGPAGSPLRVEADRHNQFTIDVDERHGWAAAKD